MAIIKGNEGTVRIRHEGAMVLMDINGRSMAIPWEAALEMAKHLRNNAKRAEEYAKADQVIMDNAILHRAGSFIGLSHNRDIIKETVKEAAWNSDLRRYMRGGVKAQGIVYPPGLYKHPVKKDQNDGSK